MKKWYALAGVLCLFSVLLLSSCASRRTIPVEDGWEFLGSQKVNFVRDVDELQVTSPYQFTALRFRVENRELHVNHIKIFFQNGDVLEPKVSEDYLAGEESRVMELGGEGRAINRIEFRYRTVGKVLKGRAEVIVYGRRYGSARNE